MWACSVRHVHSWNLLIVAVWSIFYLSITINLPNMWKWGANETILLHCVVCSSTKVRCVTFVSHFLDSQQCIKKSMYNVHIWYNTSSDKGAQYSKVRSEKLEYLKAAYSIQIYKIDKKDQNSHVGQICPNFHFVMYSNRKQNHWNKCYIANVSCLGLKLA